MHQLKDRLSEGIKKQGPTICCLKEIYFKYKSTGRLKVNKLRKFYHNQKNDLLAKLVSEKHSKKGKS